MSSIRNGVFGFLALSALTLGSVTAEPVNEGPGNNNPDYVPPPLEMRSLASPCPGPNCGEVVFPDREPIAQGLRVVYLNFDGVTLTASNSSDNATTNTSAIVNSSTEVIAAFQPNQLGSSGGLSRSQIIQQVVSDSYALHADYNIEFVTTRPSSGVYSMVVFGGSCQSVVGDSGCAGIALRDCGDYMAANITFCFPPGLRVGDLATTAAQEAAHAFGLGHTDDRYDVMYPSLQSYIPDSYGAGNVPDGSACGGASYQDSNALMLQIIGPRGQDTTGPTVNITEPLPGAVVGGGTVVRATASDNIAVDKVDLELDGEVIRSSDNPPYEWALSASITPGEHLLTVRAYDSSGNSGFKRITVRVPDGSEPPCANASDCDTGFVCQSNICVPEVMGGLGTECTGNDECLSNLCGALGDTSRCTQSCNEASPCPAGFDCITGGACWPTNPPGGGDDDGGICSASRTPGSSGLAGLALLALLVGFRLRRRRC
jgi:MYXO-CTERM domain-containing protein